ITESGLVPGVAANYTAIQKAIRTLYESGQFETVWIRCELLDAPAPRTVYQILVAERPVLDNVDVVGPQAISLGTVRDRVNLLIGRPVNPANVAADLIRIDSLYRAQGYWNARVVPETTVTAAE